MLERQKLRIIPIVIGVLSSYTSSMTTYLRGISPNIKVCNCPKNCPYMYSKNTEKLLDPVQDHTYLKYYCLII